MRTAIRVVSPTFLFLAIASGILSQESSVGKQESVQLAYELFLTKCKGSSCRTESAAKGKVQIQLEAEDQSFAWGYKGAQARTDRLSYYLRFKASHGSKTGLTKMGLDIGFAGRVETPFENKQVTWVDKLFTAKEWNAFPPMSVLGKKYLDGEETVTPRLDVRVLLSE